MAKFWPSQNFPGIYTMIFSEKTTRVVSIPKIRKKYSGIWKLEAKHLQNCQFWPKNGKILTTNGQILAISESSRHIHYDSKKKTTRVVSIPKLLNFIAAFGRHRPKTLKNGYFGQKWQNFDHFGHFGAQKIFEQKNFWWSSKSYGDTTSCKK